MVAWKVREFCVRVSCLENFVLNPLNPSRACAYIPRAETFWRKWHLNWGLEEKTVYCKLLLFENRSCNLPLSPPLRNPTITGPIGANCVTDSCGVERWESYCVYWEPLTLGLWYETYVVVGCRWGVGVWCWRGVELICGKMYRFKVCDFVGTTEFNELSPLAILHFTLGVWCSLMWCGG